MYSIKSRWFLFILVLLTACGDAGDGANQQSIAVNAKALAKTIKYSEGDPFIETIKKSEFFKASGLEDKVIETTNGTLISIPRAAFKDARGNTVEQEVTIEVTDIASFEEQFNANITSAEGQNVLLNGGALYFNATRDGEQLTLNQENPIYVESAQKADSDVVIFEGIRNDKGEMQWINPKQPKKFLVPVDLSALDFRPAGFANEVEKLLPFGTHTTATEELIDSLYYSLALKPSGAAEDDVELDRQYRDANAYASYYALPEQSGGDQLDSAAMACAAINPASVKVIKGKKFAQTFIATKQFETRMQAIHRTRDQQVFEIYTSNLTKDLAYCDSLAGRLCNRGSSLELQFDVFAKENWGNLEKLPRSVRKLGEYYTNNLNKVEEELLAAKKAYQKALDKKAEKAEKIRKEYQALLTKRQSYRAEKHGFVLSSTGWVAPGIVVIKPLVINLQVTNGADFDRVNVYTIDPSIQSIFAWQSSDNIHFKYAFAEDRLLIYKANLKGKALVVAYKGVTPYYDLQHFVADDNIEIDFIAEQTTQGDLDQLLKELDGGSKRYNKIEVDLSYQAFFHQEKLRMQRVQTERMAMYRLTSFVYGCNLDDLAGPQPVPAGSAR